MGALPSHEAHERGLYSHRHGRNRRNEIILIPLTTAFFPSPDCPLFQHLYSSRYRRTPKYYFRALRSAQTPRESDYFCTTSAVNEEEAFEEFYREYLEKRELGEGRTHTATVTAASMSPIASSPLLSGVSVASSSGVDTEHANVPVNATPSAQSSHDCLNARGLPPRVDPMDFRSYSDTREGLYQVLIRDNEPGVFATDEELRQAYWKQLQEQQTERQRVYQQKKGRAPDQATAGSAGTGGWAQPPLSALLSPSAGVHDVHAPQGRPNAPGTPAAASAPVLPMEELTFDEFVAGYVAAKRYMKGKLLHTHYRTTAAGDVKRDSITPAEGAAGSAKALNEFSGSHYKHVTSPVAYAVRPLPCVVASRYDPGKPQPVDDPLYVQFGDSYLRIMGMFGLFPSTVGMRRVAGCGDAADGTGAAKPQRSFPRKEGNSNGDDMDGESEIEQHLLKGTMFVDKDVGDQILGNMVMLATYMYVRQCIEARIHPHSIPMLPVLIRFPLSNIPMLQFVREFRVRLRSLLEAGTAKAGQKPVHTGMSGFNPEDLAEPHHPLQQRLEEEGYLFEPDIPSATSPLQLFMSAEQANSTNAPLRRHTGMKTLSCGKYPILMMSGFNVQSTPLRHPALNTTGYPPAMAAAAMITAAQLHPAVPSPLSSSIPAPLYTTSGAAGGVGHVSTFPLTVPPPPLPPMPPMPPLTGQVGSPSASSVSALPPPPPPPPLPGASALASGATTSAEEARKTALLHRRKHRFRIWVEDGHICIWASAAYARRAALIMAQQLNTTVDSNSVPEQRSWNYRGLLHANTTVPPPRHVNDVIIVAEDIPTMGLWQGDVLRCCTQEELQAMIRSKGMGPLPLPCTLEDTPAKGAVTAGITVLQAPSPYAAPTKLATAESIGDAKSSSATSITAVGNIAAAGGSGHVNYTSNHVSNPLLQERETAVPEAFWVRGAGGLDDSFTNITETNMPPHPKAERQQLQAAMQRAKKAAAAATAAQSSRRKRRSVNTEAVISAAAQLFVDIDRREGTLNIEEVVLAWMKVVAILTRDSTEEDRAWVRDPHGKPVRIDRYVIRRYEHDGVRFFIGVTPRFVGQQRRIEKVLGEVYALEESEGRRWCLPSEGRDRDDDADDDAYSEEAGRAPQFPLPLVSWRKESLSYAAGTSAASSLKVQDSGAGGMGSMFDDVWGTTVMPVSRSPPSNNLLTPAAPLTVGPARRPSLIGFLNEVRPQSESEESAGNSARLKFAVAVGGTTPAAVKAGATAASKARGAEQVGPASEVDDLLERYASDPLLFGTVDDE